MLDIECWKWEFRSPVGAPLFHFQHSPFNIQHPLENGVPLCFNRGMPRFQSAISGDPPTPPKGAWTPEAVRQYAELCLLWAGIKHLGWSFDFDRGKRRLGCCNFRYLRISLSLYFVEHYKERNPELILRTIYHELAHALAYVYHRATGHGACWRFYCAQLGIPNERASCSCPDFAPEAERPFRYAICHTETGEVFRSYKNRPRISAERLAQAYIRGRAEETRGKLCLVELREEC